MKKFEDLLDDLGGFSRLQFLMVFGVFSMKFVIGFSILQMAFMGVVPDFHCITDKALLHHGKIISPKFRQMDLFLHKLNNRTLNTCQVNHKDCKSYLFVGDPHTIISEWNLVCDQFWVKSTTTSVQMMGVFLGALLGGQLGDLFGRKKTIYGFYLLHAVFNLIAAFSSSWPMYMVLRFFIGIGIGATLVLLMPYPMEFLPVCWRATLPVIPMFPFGASAFGLAAWILKDWSHLHLLCAALSIPNLFGFFIIPESFRWLTVKGRVKEAYRVVERMGEINRRPVPSYALDIIKTIAKEERRWGQDGRRYSYVDLFRGKAICRCTVAFAFMWCFMSIGFYGPSFGVSGLGGNVYLHIILINIVDVPISYLTYLINNRVGRRSSQSGLLVVSCLALIGCLIVLWTDSGEQGKTASICLSLIAKTFMAGAWKVSQAWVAEVYPTVIRNLGYGMANMAARVGGIIAPFAIDLKEYPTASYIFTCLVTLLCLLATFFVPDTKNMVLSDSFVMEEEGEKPRPLLMVGETQTNKFNDSKKGAQDRKQPLEEDNSSDS